MKSARPACPVPDEQLPVNEYQQLQESSFFNWAGGQAGAYLRRWLWLWLWGWLVAGPVAAASFSPDRDWWRFLLTASLGAEFLPVLVMLRLYLGWRYVGDRLNQPTVFYEESGWYDGQTWPKPPEVWQRDRLIVTHQIQPILRRLHLTMAIAVGLSGLALCLYQVPW
jgi:hypothetical protein